MIAAANIVLVAIVLWQRQAHKERPDATPKPAAEETSANRPAKDEDRNPAAPVK